MKDLYEYIENQIWIKDYPIRYAGCRFNSRMTVIRLSSGRLFIHSPCEIDPATRSAIDALGEVEFIAAPGTFHHLHVASAQQAFPNAETFICPGIERKNPKLRFDGQLGDQPDDRWKEDFDQVLLRGNKLMWEVAFFHKPSKTLILVDLIEYFTDDTEDVSWTLKMWWGLFRMWDKAKPAPEYQMGWKDKKAATECLERILEWDFERIIISHGDLIEADAKAITRQAWQKVLAAK